jgi:hypothetical protein
MACGHVYWALTNRWSWMLARVWSGQIACDHYTSSTLIGGKGQSRSKFASHYAWGTSKVSECKMDVKSTRHRMDRVVWSLGLFSKPQNLETVALRTLKNVDLFYFIMSKDLTWIIIRRNGIWSRAHAHMTPHYTWGPVTTCMILKVPFGLSKSHGLGSWLVCEVALSRKPRIYWARKLGRNNLNDYFGSSMCFCFQSLVIGTTLVSYNNMFSL